MPQISADLLKYFKNFCSSPNVIMLFVYMKCRFSLSYRELEEMMIMRGASVDHSTLQRWVKRFTRLIIDKRVRGRKKRTKDALWEMNSALMTEHLLTYIGDVDFRQAIQGGLCRGEAYHQLRRTIEKINGRHFRGTSDTQMATWNECARLLANCVIYYNAVILNELKEESDSRGDVERSQKLIRFSPAAWAHINFQGRYIFMDNSFLYDIKNEIKNLFDLLVQ